MAESWKCFALFIIFVVCNGVTDSLSTATTSPHLGLSPQLGLSTNRVGSLATTNKHTGGLWMDSVMFQYILRWEEEEEENWKYTVYQKHHFGSKWTAVSWCSNISRTYCDLTKELHTYLTYDIEVRIESEKTAKRFNKTTFCGELDTKILPPKYDVSRMIDVMFIRPITDDYESNLEELELYSYQVKYWPVQKNIDSGSDVKRMEFHFGNTETGIKNLNPDLSYCVTVRLYEQSLAESKRISGSSMWSKVVCVNATIVEETASSFAEDMAIAGAAIALTLVIAVFCSIKIFSVLRRIRKHDEELPEYLDAINHEMKNFNGGVTEPAFSVGERIDKIDRDNSYVKLDPLSSVQQGFEVRQWLYSTHETNELERREFDDVIEPTSEQPASSSPRRLPRSRARSRSRGYYSFSSDDVIYDDSATLAYDSYVDMNHADSTAARDMGPTPFNVAMNQSPTSCLEAESLLHSEYLNMHGWNPNSDQVRIFSLSQTHSLMVRRGELPYENLSYCSQLYGNIPDALACGSSQLKLCTKI